MNFALEIQVTDSMLSGLFWKFLVQQRSAYKSWFIGTKYFHPKAATHTRVAPRETFVITNPKLAWIWGFWVV